MKQFYPDKSVRLAGFGLIVLLVILPVLIGFRCVRAAEPDAVPILLTVFFGIALLGGVLIHIGFWEKCFSHLELTEKEIRWVCPLRRSRIMQAESCVEIGAYLENEGHGIPTEQIYFSDHANPKRYMDKNGSMRPSSNLVKFWYSELLCQYLLRTYSGKQTSCLLTYRQRRKRK